MPRYMSQGMASTNPCRIGALTGTAIGVAPMIGKGTFTRVGFQLRDLSHPSPLVTGITPWVTAVAFDSEARVLARPWAGVSAGYTF